MTAFHGMASERAQVGRVLRFIAVPLAVFGWALLAGGLLAGLALLGCAPLRAPAPVAAPAPQVQAAPPGAAQQQQQPQASRCDRSGWPAMPAEQRLAGWESDDGRQCHCYRMGAGPGDGKVVEGVETRPVLVFISGCLPK